VIEIEKRQPNRERNVNITFRVTEKEHEMILRRMEQTGIQNLRAFLLKMAIDGHVIQLDLSGVRDMVRLLKNATDNINQIARRVNATDNLYAGDVANLQHRYEDLWEQAGSILRKLGEL